MKELSNFLVGASIFAAALLFLVWLRQHAVRRRAEFWTLSYRELTPTMRVVLALLLVVTCYGLFVRTAKQMMEAQRIYDISKYSTDVRSYLTVAQGVAGGGIPWRDVPFEYPPTAGYLVSIPALGHPNITREEYTLAYIWYAALFTSIGTVAFVSLWLSIGAPVARVVIASGVWSAVIANMGELTFLRMDTMIAILTVVGLAAAVAPAKPNGNARVLVFVGGLALGIASAKLYPLIISIPVLFFTAERKVVSWFLLGFVLGLIPMIVPALLGPIGAREFIRYHTQRNFEVGSLYAVLFQGAPEGRISFAFGSVEWRFFAESALKSLANALTVVSVIAPIVVGFRHRGSRQVAMWSGGAALAGFILFNKVGSPQYAIWLLAVAAANFVWGTSWQREGFVLACVVLFAIAGMQQMLHFRFGPQLPRTFAYLTAKIVAEIFCFVAFWAMFLRAVKHHGSPQVASELG